MSPRPLTPLNPPNTPQTQTQTHPAPSPARSPLAKRPKPSSSSSSSSTTTIPPPNAMSSTSAHPPLLIQKLTPTARTPTRGSAFAAGYDIYASAATLIPARGRGLVATGLAVAVPGGTYGRIAPRSGLAVKSFIDTGAGVVDADYRGEVRVLLFNHGEGDFEVKEGDRVAQLVLERIYTPEVVVMEELEESVRGAGGFGSTG